MIDGTGAPTQGPVDIVVENDRIAQVQVVGFPQLAIDPEDRPPLNGGRELDIAGMYLLPGFINTHLHLHSRRSGQNVPAEYVLKLWLAHGITSGRTVGGDHGTPWEIDIAKKLAANAITGPRLAIYPAFNAEEAGLIATPAEARQRIRDIKRMGGSGVKFFGAPEQIMTAALDEARKQGLNSTMHHAQLAVKHANVLSTSARGLRSMEHWYGLPEALFEDRSVQHYPHDYVYQNEQHRFAEAGFTPLEVLHAATLVGAQLIGIDEDVGSIQVGKKADFVVVEENPLANLHVLFGTGTIRLNDETGEVERVGGIRYTIKDGIVYDTPELLCEIRDMVREQKRSRGIPEGPMPIETVPAKND